MSPVTPQNFKIGNLEGFEKIRVLYVAIAEKPLFGDIAICALLRKMRESRYLRNGTSDHQNEKRRPLRPRDRTPETWVRKKCVFYYWFPVKHVVHCAVVLEHKELTITENAFVLILGFMKTCAICLSLVLC